TGKPASGRSRGQNATAQSPVKPGKSFKSRMADNQCPGEYGCKHRQYRKKGTEHRAGLDQQSQFNKLEDEQTQEYAFHHDLENPGTKPQTWSLDASPMVLYKVEGHRTPNLPHSGRMNNWT